MSEFLTHLKISTKLAKFASIAEVLSGNKRPGV